MPWMGGVSGNSQFSGQTAWRSAQVESVHERGVVWDSAEEG